MNENYRTIFLILILAVVAVFIAGITNYFLYNAAFEQNRERLMVTAKSQARIMEAIARFDAQYSTDYPGGADAATISQIRSAHNKFKGFGKTGEFLLARRNKDKINFMFRQRHNRLAIPKPVLFDSKLAEPMRRALSGQSGTLVGLDYRGELVLAAHEPVAVLNLGIVAKIDLEEIRAPFVKTGIITGALALIAIFVGAFLFVRTTNPMIRRIQESEAKYRDLVETSQDLIWRNDREGRFTYLNPAWESTLGYSLEEMIGHEFPDFKRPGEREQNFQRHHRIMQGEPATNYETTYISKSGEEVILNFKAKPLFDASGQVVGAQGTATDITESKRAEEELKKIEWQLQPRERLPKTDEPTYGDLTEIATSRVIMDSVGKNLLRDIADSTLNIIETSWAVYEKNGDYASRIIASDWCRLIDNASRELCATDDNREALECGKWLCHESCWEVSRVAMETGRTYMDLVSACGINFYAVPINAGGDMVGAVIFCFGDPPTEPRKLKEIAKTLKIEDTGRLLEAARSYESRPPFIIDLAKQRLQHSANLIGEIVNRKRAEEALRESEIKFRDLVEGSIQGINIQREGKSLFINKTFANIFGYDTPEDWLALESYAHLAPKNELARMKTYREARLRGEDAPNQYQFQAYKKDGTPIWLETNINFVTWEGKPAVQSTAIDITERQRSEEQLRERTHDLGERVKELNCLYSISNLIETPGITIEELYQGAIDLIPFSWQYPEITCARLIIEDQEFTTINWEETIWKQSSKIVVNREETGVLEICYLKECPDSYEGPFLKEERNLINAICGLLGRITDRKRTEEALRESEERFRVAIMNSPITVHTQDLELRYMWVFNKDADFAPESVLGKRDEDFLSPENATELTEFKKRIIDSGVGDRKEISFNLPDGVATYDITCEPLRDAQGTIVGITGAGVNITERKRAEEELLEANQRLKYLSQHTLQILETERRRIAQELHDDIGQTITALKIKMEDLKIKNKSTKLTSNFEECIQVAELALNDVRTLSLDLRPAKLDDLGLTAALRWLLDRQANVAGFNAHFQEDHISGHDLPKHLEITSFRVAQEALTNVVRHAHSDNVFLKLFRKGHELRISIQDDGKGFVVSDAFEKTHKGQCLGLLGMQERVALASGRLKITSSAERGTKVLAVFPLTQPNEEIL